MVAPIDSTVVLKAAGEEFTLRLNFRSIALAEDAGVDLMAGKLTKATRMAVMLRCLAHEAHPEMTDEDAFALLIGDSENCKLAIGTLFERFTQKQTPQAKAAVKAGDGGESPAACPPIVRPAMIS